MLGWGRKPLGLVLLGLGLISRANAEVGAPTASQDYLKVILMLIFVVGLIFACAWLIRRMSGGVGLNQKHIQVLSVMPLGTREKLMIIRAASEYLLIGVTPNGIQTLHRFEEPIDLNGPAQASPFADRLKGLLKGFDSEPMSQHKKSPNDTRKD
jgi:flagellar protein FliO/FliZ|tara:strand:+ start:552 stop:1013 length:462 start_codon:yes stop_codon:yes gene_type:complete